MSDQIKFGPAQSLPDGTMIIRSQIFTPEEEARINELARAVTDQAILDFLHVSRRDHSQSQDSSDPKIPESPSQLQMQ